jgi:hypothetical protein
VEEIAIPLVADMQFEYSQALTSGSNGEARWVYIRACWALFVALGIDRLLKAATKIFSRSTSR